MKRTLISLAVLALVVTGCGRDDDTDALPDPTFATPSATTSAPATPTPTEETEETPDPDAPPIDYSEEGGALVTGSDAGSLAGAPKDFSTFVTQELARLRATGIEGCSNDPQIRVDTVQGGGWAAGGVTAPECGGYAVLWARTGSQWSQVWSGQELVDCRTLQRFSFPVSVVGTQCLGQNGTASTYSG